MDKEEECNTSLMGCDPNAVCKLTRRGYRCSCKKGWQGNGKICKDINECVVRDGGCVHNCHNTPGSYRCSCHSGFKADPDDNHNCLDIDECVVNKGGCEEDCINTIGSYECRCSKDGYFFGTNQKHCRSGNAACSAHGCHQTCELAHNMRLKSCSCWPGYHINATDGKSCMRTCRLGNGGCHHHCLDTETGPICTCHHTYLLGLDVHSCAASCAVNNGGCQKRCMNTNIGVICSCPSGYNLNANGKSCEDIDECAISNGGCENQCVNNIGSYECICPSGYKLNPSDEKTCVDIDECELNHTCEHICVNTPGSYRCECHRGYKLYGISHCGDIDECSIGNGGCPHICINDNGGYHCSTIDENKILTYSTECVGSYIASSKYLIIGLASERNNILKLFGEQFILKFKELGINECDIHIQRMHNVNAKRIYRKYGVAEGKPLQVTLDVICKTVNVTNSCDQQCAITNASQALCKALSLMRKALSGSFYVIVENKNLSAIPRSFSVQQMYTSPCHTKGERKRIKDICLEPKKAGSLTQVVRKIDGKLEARLSALSRGTARNIDDCSAGTYWEEVKKTCELCMKNTYQQKSGQKYCLKCPGNSQTDGEGATSVDDCKDRRCKNYINELSGFIESPNYPGPYPSNSDCTWILKPPKRRRLLIIVPEIDLAGDKCEDYLVMRKSRSPYSTVTFEACKSIKKPIAFTAQSRTLWMHFQSDSYNNSKGFHIPFVTYNEEYQSLIEDIVQDSRLYASHNHLEILRDQKLLGALMEVIAQPINYYKYENEQRKMFPSSFIRFVTPKVRKFFSYRR
ncbi:signal peptide, CUB and EGF-like domain-containing protein 1 isoform X2 [Anabrus simplex]|uniref:signal peptide, CUB and EGF-like domain-containing protein 1 isoform X2 n=1 Tax=Anabrus simplex TaxID=316456 RepID=UPI0035A2D3C7